DGSGSPPLPDGVLLIRGERIAEVGPAGQVRVPPVATVLDAGGRTVVPGMIESHVHIEDDIPRLLRAFLADGVTTVGNTGSTPGAVNRFHEAGTLADAARGFIAGPTITAPGGYPSMRMAEVAHGITGPESGRAAVRYLAALGVDFVKVALEPLDFTPQASGALPVPAPEAVRAVVAEANAHGLPVRAHIRYADQLKVALDAGVTSVEHMLFALPERAGYRELCAGGLPDPSALPGLAGNIRRMAGEGVYVVPTIGTETANIGRGLGAAAQDVLPRVQQAMVGVLAEFVGAGGRVALGSDWVGIPGIPPGLPRAEMAFLVRAGLSPLQVVEAGTRHAAA
ncbi:MAG: amidohydrolase family protein, partial [Acidimicrobiales bacterium]